MTITAWHRAWTWWPLNETFSRTEPKMTPAVVLSLNSLPLHVQVNSYGILSCELMPVRAKQQPPLSLQELEVNGNMITSEKFKVPVWSIPVHALQWFVAIVQSFVIPSTWWQSCWCSQNLDRHFLSVLATANDSESGRSSNDSWWEDYVYTLLVYTLMLEVLSTKQLTWQQWKSW